VAAHPYIGVACSSALRLGLHSRSLGSLSLTQEQLQERERAFITVLKVDLYSSLVLGLPAFIDLRSFDHDLLVSRSTELFNLPFSERSHRNNAIRLELSLKHLELLKITAFGLEAVFPQVANSNDAANDDFMLPVDVKRLEVVGDHFQAWARSTSCLLRGIGTDAEWEL
jgi:hypothetical protein